MTTGGRRSTAPAVTGRLPFDGRRPGTGDTRLSAPHGRHDGRAMSHRKDATTAA